MSRTPVNEDARLLENDAIPSPGVLEPEASVAEAIVRPPRPGKMREAAPPARPRKRVWRRPVVIVVLLAATGVAVYYGFGGRGGAKRDSDIQLFKVTRRSFPVILQEKGELLAARSIDIRSELEGRATIIYLIDEGTHVKKGDLLVELASDEIDDKIRDAEIKVALAKAAAEASEKELEILRDKNASEKEKADLTLWLAEHAVEKFKEGEAAQLRQADQLALEKARYVLQRAEDRLKDSEELYEQGYITRLELEADKFEKYQAQIELQKADLALKVTEKYTVPMGLQEKQAAVEEARREQARQRTAAGASEAKALADVQAKKSELNLSEEKLSKYRDQKIKAKIVAPEEGLVAYARDRDWHGSDSNRIETGATVHERQQLIELPDTSQMKVVLRIHEAKTERLKVGLPATVEIEGFSGRRFTGRVSKIAVLADSRNRWLNPNLKEYETEILLDGKFTELKPGTTARVQILIAELQNVLAVPVQSVFGKGGQYYVFVDERGTARPVEVKLGLSSNEYAEIRSGLNEGQMVRLAVTDEMKLALPEGRTVDEDVVAAPAAAAPAPPVAPAPSNPPTERRKQRPSSTTRPAPARS